MLRQQGSGRAEKETHCVFPPAARHLSQSVSTSTTQACACYTNPNSRRAITIWQPQPTRNSTVRTTGTART